MLYSVKGVETATSDFAGLGVLMGYANEKKAVGSLIPSWCIHALANIFLAHALHFHYFDPYG